MKYILRQFGLTALCFVVLYSVLLAITFIIKADAARNGSLDVWTAGDTLYLTSPKYAFLGRDVLNVPDQKVILVGASNIRLPMNQGPAQALSSCAKLSNLAIGSANITEVRQMIDLVHDVQDPDARRSNVFVIGVWFGMFVDTERLWPGAGREHGDTDLDIERYRYGFYRRTADGPVAVLPPQWLRAGVTMIRPYLLLEKAARWATSGLRSSLLGRPPVMSDDDREAVVLSDADKAKALGRWRQTMGGDRPISATQVVLLQDTIENLLQSGEKVVLVDLPMPTWHRDASPYLPEYASWVQDGVFEHFEARAGFSTLKMQDLDADADYTDEVHPKPHLARIWAQRLKEVLSPMVCDASIHQTANYVVTSPAGVDGVAAQPSIRPGETGEHHGKIDGLREAHDGVP